MTITVEQTPEFTAWYVRLRDVRAKAAIADRIDRLRRGNYGDAKFFDGIGELRIDRGPGYRLYFRRRGSVLVVLLLGGDKSSQERDIKRAVEIAREL